MGEYTFSIYAILCILANIVVIVLRLIFRVKDSALDDSAWNYDKQAAFASLQKYVSNTQETFIDILGINNLFSNSFKNGFCFVTDKAYYFIGKISQKKFFIRWKSNIQHRIVNSELKGVKVSQCIKYRYVIYTAVLGCVAYGLYYLIPVPYVENWSGSDFNSTYALWVLLILEVPVCFLHLLYTVLMLFMKRRTYMCLEFVSQTFYFPIDILGKSEIKSFYANVSRVQELVEKEMKMVVNASQPVVNTPQMVAVSKGKVERLTELSKLYEQSLISQEEFLKLKSEIVNE